MTSALTKPKLFQKHGRTNQDSSKHFQMKMFSMSEDKKTFLNVHELVLFFVCTFGHSPFNMNFVLAEMSKNITSQTDRIHEIIINQMIIE